MNLFSILLVVSCLTNSSPSALHPSTREGQGEGTVITFVGDVLLDRGVRQVIDLRGVDHLFTPEVDRLFRTSDVVVANLECPATEVRQPVFKRFCFRGEPKWLPALHRHGITHLNLANNHSVDQGRKGLTSTIEHVRRAGMVPIGAGRTMQEAVQPVLLTSSPRKVFLLASVQMALENYPYLPAKPSVSQMTIDSLSVSIQRLKRQHPGCAVVVSLHWGGEHTTEPIPAQRVQAHRLVDAGADALVCHHTHTLQTVETYRGRPIYYSIGNFIFDQPKPLNSRAAIVQLHVTRNTVAAHTIPIEIRHCVPHIVKE
ncbi:MAG: CapA family protein [Bacteroidaceae bacterium]|nr:CapA family protein [Bacteroidaceae bacterium]